MKRSRSPRADLSTWRENPDGSRARTYASYQAYVNHQESKLGTMTPDSLRENDERLRAALMNRLSELPFSLRGKAALCLGARTGAEVSAFHFFGSFAVGIDLNPGPANHHVLPGDFHGTVFPECSVDVVYTNALDHAHDLPKVIQEARRLLRIAPAGHLVVDATTKVLGEYESFAWESIDGLQATIEAQGFRLIERNPIAEPWAGEQLVLVRA